MISNYLEDRRQFVYVNNTASEVGQIKSGVPQGSVLGPLLFLIYINGIFKLKLHSHIQLYADDVALVLGESNLSSLKQKMEEDIRVINSWVTSMKLSLNFNKSKFILFKRKNADMTNNFDTILVNDNCISSVEHFDYLGLRIDENLNWQHHIKKVCSKISPYVFGLRKARYCLNNQTMQMLYNSYVHSHIIYLLPIWGNAPLTYLNSLQFLQNKILKIIRFLSHDTPTQTLYSRNLLSINQQFIYESIFLIYKMLNGFSKTSFNFTTNLAATGRTTRSAMHFQLPNFRTNIAKTSIFYEGLKQFNSLPNSMKSTPISNFKNKLKIYVFDTTSILRISRSRRNSC